jgi:hypothetical protein
MSALLIFAGFALAAAACCGIKALVWLAGARPGRLLPRDHQTAERMWVW